MYYEIFKQLCEKEGVRPADIARATGISTATLTNWKQGKYTPKENKLKLIADFFGVSTEYLRTGKEPQVIKIDPRPFRKFQEMIDEQTAPGLSEVIKLYIAFDEHDRYEVLTLMRIKFEKYRAIKNND